MGGSGSSYFGSDLDTLRQKLRESEKRTEDTKYEAEVANVLAGLLTQYNDRDIEAINRHLDEIKRALEKEIEGTVNLLFGGSVAKHTYVDGLSDVDSLVILDSCDLANGSPDAAKEYFAQRLLERFPKTDVEVGRLAVTVRFSDAEIQLLPAISCQRDVKIADQTGHNWAQIKPKNFTEVLTRTNQQAGGKVVPIVKLAKAIIVNLPEKHRISGYHAESLAVEIFKNYSGEQKPKVMLEHYFQQASLLVQQPIRDRTGQSVHVDDYLGAPNSLERQLVSDAFSRVYRRMNNADNAGSIDQWHKLFGE
jgi:CRISPR/Cas system-associated exonuclease Cas4 (RecB family)